MAEGTVTFFNNDGGYGFIETDEIEDDVFFHMSFIGGDDLEEGQEVTFEIEQTDEGPRAQELERVDEEDAEE